MKKYTKQINARATAVQPLKPNYSVGGLDVGSRSVFVCAGLANGQK